jgi:dTDP-4-dehydrorhamnose reductase
MKVLVLGSGGQLGAELCRQLGTDALGFGRKDLDITDRPLAARTIRELNPQSVINAAAYTAVDKAEAEPELCEATNARAVGNLAEVCREVDCPLVQISTDYVFGADRSRRVPYREDDQPGPQGVYAKSKLSGEQQAAHAPKHIVVRTCGLYGRSTGKGASNFVETMLRLGSQHSAGDRPRLRVVNDQFCTPSYVPHVARAVLFLLSTSAYGTYHVVNQGSTTWYDFAREIFRLSRLDVDIEPISTAQYAARAPRPHYSVLDCGKYLALGGPALPAWQEALAEYLADRATWQTAQVRP